MLGEDVAVLTRSETGTDEMGEPVYSWESETVHNVLVRPLAGSDVNQDARPDGVRVSYSLAFPRSWTAGKPAGYLRGARVALVARGMDPGDQDAALVVSGWPDRTPQSPLAWDTTAEVGRVDG